MAEWWGSRIVKSYWSDLGGNVTAKILKLELLTACHQSHPLTAKGVAKPHQAPICAEGYTHLIDHAYMCSTCIHVCEHNL